MRSRALHALFALLVALAGCKRDPGRQDAAPALTPSSSAATSAPEPALPSNVTSLATSIAPLRDYFDARRGEARFVAILSPS